MTLARCPFCTHSNPAGACFCNKCGSPDVDTVAADDNADGRVALHVSTARLFLTFVAAVAIVGLAALGGYTFIQLGEAPLEAPPSPSMIPAPATADMSTTPAALPPVQEPALPNADTKATQDAIETQRIIMRELGSFSPPTR